MWGTCAWKIRYEGGNCLRNCYFNIFVIVRNVIMNYVCVMGYTGNCEVRCIVINYITKVYVFRDKMATVNCNTPVISQVGQCTFNKVRGNQYMLCCQFIKSRSWILVAFHT